MGSIIQKNNYTQQYNALLQSTTITGTITDCGTGTPIVGASIQAGNTTIFTATDVDGKFSITIPAGVTFIWIRYLGFLSIKVNIGGLTVLNQCMEEDL